MKKSIYSSMTKKQLFDLLKFLKKSFKVKIKEMSLASDPVLRKIIRKKMNEIKIKIGSVSQHCVKRGFNFKNQKNDFTNLRKID